MATAAPPITATAAERQIQVHGNVDGSIVQGDHNVVVNGNHGTVVVERVPLVIGGEHRWNEAHHALGIDPSGIWAARSERIPSPAIRTSPSSGFATTA